MKCCFDELKRAKTVGLFGIGVSSLGVLRYLGGGYRYTLRSDKPIDRAALPKELAGAEIFEGADAYSDIQEDILFLSPSVKRERQELISALSRGVLLSSDIELFLERVMCPVFAVSGSDGKSTTCELARRLLSCSGVTVHKSGNCGRSALSALAEEQADDAHVIELSSFMLEYIKPMVYRSVITNITENHLDWHGSFDGYIRAKKNLTENARECALWYDDEICRSIADGCHAKILISEKMSAKELAAVCDASITLESGNICVDGRALLPISEIKRREPYNIKNFMSALALCYGHFDKDSLLKVAREFNGIEHRCQSLGIFGGTEYIDSSIDSTPERTRQTLSGLKRRAVLILGGRGKGLSYAPIKDVVLKYCDAVVLNGENAEQIRSELMSCDKIASEVPIYKCSGLGDAIDKARSLADGCGLVLLSPASTSYNEFKNFEERAEFFRKSVTK